MSKPPIDLSIYLVTDPEIAAAQGRSVAETVRQAITGGVTTVQIREKNAPAGQFLKVVQEVAGILPPGIALIVNDRVDVYLAARQAGLAVSGVHIGQNDLSVEHVRAMIGPDAMLGLSATHPDEINRAATQSVDYLGIGAVRATATKPDAPEPIGIAGFAQRAAITALPAVAIGGIGPADVSPLRQAGAAGIAIVSGIMGAADPAQATRAYVEAWEAGG